MANTGRMTILKFGPIVVAQIDFLACLWYDPIIRINQIIQAGNPHGKDAGVG
jgi:hypothetical protein